MTEYTYENELVEIEREPDLMPDIDEGGDPEPDPVPDPTPNILTVIKKNPRRFDGGLGKWVIRWQCC